MGRIKSRSLLGILIRLPWWAAALGVLAALGARQAWLVWAESSTGMFAPLVQPLSILFYGAAAVFALGALASLARQWLNGRKLARQTGRESIAQLGWREFESIIQEVFRRKGYLSVESPAGPDGGYDIGLRRGGELYLVQCKHWKSRQVGVKPIRELWGVITARKAAGGFFVISGSYTAEAKAFASLVNLELIDGAGLERLVRDVQGSSQVQQQKQQRTESTITTTPNCPKCGSEMVRRVARKGANAGKAFWGCGEYPRCRGVVDRR